MTSNGVIYEYDGRQWTEERQPDLGLYIAKLARCYGWTIDCIMGLTMPQVRVMLDKLPRVLLDEALYTAAWFGDSSVRDAVYDADLTPRERWEKAVTSAQEVMSGK